MPDHPSIVETGQRHPPPHPGLGLVRATESAALAAGRWLGKGERNDADHAAQDAMAAALNLMPMKGRIISIHLKDVAEWGKPGARDVILGQGLADYAGVLKELKAQGFKGGLNVEYEHDTAKLEEEVAACKAYVEKTAGQLV